MKLLQIDFPMNGPFGQAMSEAFETLAEDISKEDGLIWKIWTENSQTKEAGGVYIFEDEATVTKYLEKHIARLEGFGIQNIRAKVFDVNLPLSKIDRAPL